MSTYIEFALTFFAGWQNAYILTLRRRRAELLRLLASWDRADGR